MHEQSIARALIARIEEVARQQKAVSVRRVTVRIGEASGVEVEQLARAYQILRENTLCRDAALAIRAVAARWECPRCNRPPPPGAALRCLSCGAPARLSGGDEIALEQIELEVRHV